MKIKDLCASERPREKMRAQGAASLSNGELLAILLRSGTSECSAVEVAQKLLMKADGKLVSLFNMSGQSLTEVKGIGPDKACTLLASCELGKRFLQESSGMRKVPLTAPRMIFDMMRPQFKGIDHEECWVLLLNTSGYLIGKQQLTSGGGSSTVIDVRQTIRTAIERKASALILVHNHPSGNPRPSKADLQQTESLHSAAKACGLELIDHVIIADDCFFSFADDEMKFA